VRWAYGDWTTPQLTPWKRQLSPLGIRPRQQFHHLKGKNTSDSALIMDAMDLLHGGRVQGICIVSSDSDYVGLASRVQEAGLAVYGFGLKTTIREFVAACDGFVFLDEVAETAWRNAGFAKAVDRRGVGRMRAGSCGRGCGVGPFRILQPGWVLRHQDLRERLRHPPNAIDIK